MLSFAKTVDSEITLETMRRKRGRAKWNRYDPDVIPLMVSDPDYPVPPEIREAAFQAVKDDCWNYAWFPEAVEAMAETTRTKYGIDATVDDLMITPGVMPCIKLAAMYACKLGDEVIVHEKLVRTIQLHRPERQILREHDPLVQQYAVPVRPDRPVGPGHRCSSRLESVRPPAFPRPWGQVRDLAGRKAVPVRVVHAAAPEDWQSPCAEAQTRRGTAA